MFKKYFYACILSVSLTLASFNSVNAGPFKTICYVSDGKKIINLHIRPNVGPYISHDGKGLFKLYDANGKEVAQKHGLRVPDLLADKLHELQRVNRARRLQRFRQGRLNPKRKPSPPQRRRAIPVRPSPKPRQRLPQKSYLPPPGHSKSILICTAKGGCEYQYAAFHNQYYMVHSFDPSQPLSVMRNGKVVLIPKDLGHARKFLLKQAARK